MVLILLCISFLASVAGAICGIGGGVIIKPVLDLFQVADISAINFLSGCTVLSMSGYSVIKSLSAHERTVSIKVGTPLALGAAIGGMVGKELFTALRTGFANPNLLGALQAACLAVVTVGTLIYTLVQRHIITRNTKSKLGCVVIGLGLGMMSSFLGIGGGPINLVVLSYFFGMDTKTAAANSLYIILFSQLASLMMTLLTNTVPSFDPNSLLLMVGGGIGGGIVGRLINRRINSTVVERLFVALMVVIIGISLYNFARGIS